jgi:hypothetical protein
MILLQFDCIKIFPKEWLFFSFSVLVFFIVFVAQTICKCSVYAQSQPASVLKQQVTASEHQHLFGEERRGMTNGVILFTYTKNCWPRYSKSG